MMMPATPNLSDDQKLVDSVVYLASLSSETSTIDPPLDTLREITSNWDSVTPLSNQSRATLNELISSLKHHLVTDDPLRTFTAEELDMKLAAALAGNKNKLPNIAAVLAGCAVLASTTFVLPIDLPLADKFYIAVVSLMALIAAINAWLYLSSLKNFKPELRKIYLYISIGVSIIGLQFIHFIAIGVSGIANEPLYQYIGLPEIGATGFLYIYMGMAQYAKTLSIPTRKTNWQLAGTLVAILPLAYLVGSLRGVEHPIYFTASLISLLYIGTFGIYTVVVARKILKKLTPIYVKPLRGLYFFLLAVPCSITFDCGVLIWLGRLSSAELSLTLSIGSTVTMLILLYSGYNFKKSSLR